MLTLACVATLGWATNTSFASTWLNTGSQAKTPMGHHQYCKRGGRHCGAQRVSAPAKMTAKRWSVVKSINSRVNRAIKPATDMATRGVKEYWEVAKRHGDCEDYSMLKRSKLLRAGFKPSQLRLVKGRTNHGEAHVVLVLRTNEGDFALDNRNNRVTPVNRAGLRYHSIQSAGNASKWLTVRGFSRNNPGKS